jgi:signal transduction histidine kinase/ActR/RegA family two-component response regulator
MTSHGQPSDVAETLEELRTRLAEAEETLRAIRHGEVEAVVVEGPKGPQVYTLTTAEQPYRNLVELMQEGAVILTTGGDILYCNRRFAELVQLPLERVIGSGIDRFSTDADGSMASLLRTGRGAGRGRLRTSTGATRDVYMSVTTAVFDDVERRNLIVADLTDLIGAELDRDRAERENRAKDEFIAMLGHELRNPLGAIAGAVRVMSAVDPAESPSGRARAVIVRQVTHLSRIIDDLLDAGRLVTGKIALTRQPIDLAEVASRCLITVAGNERPVRHFDLETDSVWIDADPTRMEQIVGNLIGNAVKYTEDGGHIRIRLSAEGPDAVLEVEDDGVGIDAELLPRIFNLFVQGNQSLARVRGGLGIGLSLVRSVIELHGGNVSVASDGPGRGSRFVVRLPRIDAPPLENPSEASTIRSAKHRVLVVEDNNDTREMYRASLELAGHLVLDAADATAGLALLKSERPGIALVDIGLPGFDGYELARRFRAEPEGQSVILVALTGYGSPADRERSRRAGYDYHLVKPVSPETLEHLLASVLPAH